MAKCNAVGCEKQVGYDKLMCWQHWIRIPGDLKHIINQEWNAGRRTGTRYKQAVEAAITYIQKWEDGLPEPFGEHGGKKA